MLIARIDNDAVLSVADYRSMFPNTSFPKGPTAQFLLENSCMNVSTTVDHNAATHKVQPCEPYIDGNVVRTVEAVAKTDDDIAAETAATATGHRTTRNKLLADSDWTQMNDSPLSNEDKTAWAVYRSELRNLPDDAAWPNLSDEDWPVAP
jgi:hypothetical protein